MTESRNPLVSSSKTSDSRQSVQLHPLVLLTISDYITRHTVRNQEGPIVGAILGRQHGRNITMEHAFECKTDANQAGVVTLNTAWFHMRLQQFRDVHKVPTLDLVGWFTLTPTSGPQQAHLPIHHQLADAYNESVLFLAFHASSLQESTSLSGDKLPITVYEPVYEAGPSDGDKVMEASGEAAALSLRFRELPYNIETGDAEMIGVDFVAKGSANATAIPQSADAKVQIESKDKGKAPANGEVKDQVFADYLTPEEEDLIATISSKANTIRMLHRRLSLFRKYLLSLPPCYLNDPSVAPCEVNKQISHPILRSIAALLARLPLLLPHTPADTSSTVDIEGQMTGKSSLYEQESAAQASDVAMISLLGTLGGTIQKADQMIKKAKTVEHESNKQRGGNKSIFFDPITDSMMDTDHSNEYIAVPG